MTNLLKTWKIKFMGDFNAFGMTKEIASKILGGEAKKDFDNALYTYEKDPSDQRAWAAIQTGLFVASSFYGMEQEGTVGVTGANTAPHDSLYFQTKTGILQEAGVK